MNSTIHTSDYLYLSLRHVVIQGHDSKFENVIGYGSVTSEEHLLVPGHVQLRVKLMVIFSSLFGFSTSSLVILSCLSTKSVASEQYFSTIQLFGNISGTHEITLIPLHVKTRFRYILYLILSRMTH